MIDFRKIIYNSILTFLPLGGVSGGLLCSCSSFLEEYSQDTDYVRSWNDLDELLIGDCYITVGVTEGFSLSSNYGQCLHLIADEVEETTSGVTQDFDNHEAEFGYYTWQQRTGQNETYTDFADENTDWTKVYKCINVANNVLNSADELDVTSDADQKGLLKVKGEAHFLRGYYYFWLTNMFGKPYDPQTAATDPAVPLKTSEEVLDIKYSRNTVQECYNQVLADLTQAEKELTEYGSLQKSIYRADSVTVQLLLSRVYLYMQNWQRAAEYAQKVISVHPNLQNLNSNTAKIAQKSCVENLFSMGGSDVAVMLYDATKGMSISQSLYQCFTTNDKRKALWIWTSGKFHGLTKQPEGTRTDAIAITNRNYYYQKYNEGQLYQQSEVSSVFLLRSAEAYVNLAEAEAYMGNTDKAKDAILTLMKTRYSYDATELSNVTASNVIQTIRDERRKEFMLEGQRWFDLRRYRVCGASPTKVSITHDYTYYQERTSTVKTETHRFVLTEDDNSWTLPIPHEVLEFNTGMKNNNNQWRQYTVIN